MWTKVLEIIDRLSGQPDLHASSVGAAIGLELSPTLDDPLARQYRGELRGGPLRDVELRERPLTGVAFLVLRADPDRPVVVPYDGLKKFGRPIWRSVEPKSQPEAAVTEYFNLGGKELRVGYGDETRMLEVVSLGQQAEIDKSASKRAG